MKNIVVVILRCVVRYAINGRETARQHAMNGAKRLIFAVVALCLTACAAPPARQGAVGAGFQLTDLGKSDIDRVAEFHQQAALASLRILMEKLYRRNPREWRKGGQPSLAASVSRVFDGRRQWDFPVLAGKTGAACVHLAFDEHYHGDRVLAFIVGLASMIMASYNGKTALYIVDELDPQKLYNSARNVEIADWLLNHARDREGKPFLLSNAMSAAGKNLSFEREIGKIIADQDVLARIVADKTNRSVVHVIQSMATAIFLPI